MKTENVRANLGRTVIFDNSKYMLSAMICRRKGNGYYYQVELQDKCKRSIVIARPEEIELEVSEND
jgi:hypothetical protein